MTRYAVIALVASCLVSVASAAPVDGVRVVNDIDYVDGADYADGKDRLDLYLPEAGEKFPVLVFFHGGGLVAGDKSGSAHLGTAFASEGIGVAVVNYRLSPTIAHPGHAEDAARAIAWVHSNIRAHGGNPERIFISGHSAGGYLTALLALDATYLKAHSLRPGKLAGFMPISGFFYVDEVAPDRTKDVWGEDPADWDEASPSTYLRASAPPLLFLYADGDAPWRRKQNEDFAAALQAKGNAEVRTLEIADRDHRGIHGSIKVGDPTLDAMLAFIESH